MPKRKQVAGADPKALSVRISVHIVYAARYHHIHAYASRSFCTARTGGTEQNITTAAVSILDRRQKALMMKKWTRETARPANARFLPPEHEKTSDMCARMCRAFRSATFAHTLSLIASAVKSSSGVRVRILPFSRAYGIVHPPPAINAVVKCPFTSLAHLSSTGSRTVLHSCSSTMPLDISYLVSNSRCSIRKQSFVRHLLHAAVSSQDTIPAVELCHLLPVRITSRREEPNEITPPRIYGHDVIYFKLKLTLLV